MKKTFITTLAILITVLITSTAVQAIGTLTPSGTAGDDTYYTLNDIYAKITADTDATVGSGTMTVPSGTPAASFRTLTEVYEALPDWKTLSAATTTVSAGYYEATDLATVDTDLTAGNIKDGTTIFGVEGTVEEDSDLEWSTAQGVSGHASAESTCAALTEGGASAGDWRSPTIIELNTGILETYFSIRSNGFWIDEYYWPDSSLDFAVKAQMNGFNPSILELIITPGAFVPSGMATVRCVR
jgi:hypothetical protein